MDYQEIRYYVHKQDFFRNDFRKLSNWAFFFLMSLVLLYTGKSTDYTFIYIFYFPILLVVIIGRYIFADSYEVLINKYGFSKIKENGKVDSLPLNELASNSFEYYHNHIILMRHKKYMPDEKFKIFVKQSEFDRLLNFLKSVNLAPHLDKPRFFETFGYALRPWTIIDLISRRITYYYLVSKMRETKESTSKL